MNYAELKAKLHGHQSFLMSLSVQVNRASKPQTLYDFQPTLASLEESLQEVENESHAGKIYVALDKYKGLLTSLKRVLSLSEIGRVSALSNRMQTPIKEVTAYCQKSHVEAWKNTPAEANEYH